MAIERPLRYLNGICITLLLLAGLSWGLVGFLNWNLIEFIFSPVVARFVYALMGLAFLYEVGLRYSHMADWVCTRRHVAQEASSHA